MRLRDTQNKVVSETAASVWKTRYTRPDGRPWHRERAPKIMVLGKYTSSRGNPSVAGIDLKHVYQNYGKKGLEVLRKWMPEIFGFKDPHKQGFDDTETLRGDWEHQVQPPEEAATPETLEAIERGDFIILEIKMQPRPLKGTAGTTGRWEMGAGGIPGPDGQLLSQIFNNSYRTYLLDRMGPVIQDKLTSLDRGGLMRQAQAQVAKAAAQAPEGPAPQPTPDQPVATPKGSLTGPPPEPKTAPKAPEAEPMAEPELKRPEEIEPLEPEPEELFKAPDLQAKKVPTAEPKIGRAIDKRLQPQIKPQVPPPPKPAEPSTPAEKEQITQKAQQDVRANIQQKQAPVRPARPPRPPAFPESDFEEITPTGNTS